MENFKKIFSEKYRRILCRLGKVFLLCCSVLFLLMLGLSLIDPNPHKAKIEELILNKTGYVVILEGPLTLRAFPFLSLDAEKVKVKEKVTQQKEIVTIEKINITLSPASLIPGRTVVYLTLQDTQFRHHHIPEVKTKVTFKQESIEFRKNKIKLHKDHIKNVEFDHIKISTEGEGEPKFYLQHHGNDFQLDLLMSRFLPEHKIEGKTALQLELTAEGNSLKKLKKSLSGHVELQITQGRFYGLDLISSLKEARSLLASVGSSLGRTLSSVVEKVILKKHKISHEKTPFNQLKLTATIKEGIVKNQDLQLLHPQYAVQGIGQLNLSHETLDYQLRAVYKDKPKMKFFGRASKESAPLMIHITGPLKDPHIKTDLKSYLKYIR